MAVDPSEDPAAVPAKYLRLPFRFSIIPEPEFVNF
jgi:hypothetical protein